MKILILITLLLNALFASDTLERVLITKTSKASGLKPIKKRLDKLNFKMYVQKIPSGNFVYTKAYTNKNESTKALQKLKAYFPYAKILTIQNKKIPAKVIQEPLNKVPKAQKPDFFVNMALGYVSTKGETNDLNASKLENTGMGYMLEFGYILNEDFFFSLAYSNTSTKDIDILNYYLTANYNYPLSDHFNVFTGLILGASSLELNSYSDSSASSALLYGLQLGTSYEIMDNIHTFVNYQALLNDHTINLPDAGSKIEFSLLHNIQMGVGYKF